MVKRVRRMSDGRILAAKFLGRNRQNDEATTTEYLMMRALNHPCFIRPHALYNATNKFSVLLMDL